MKKLLTAFIALASVIALDAQSEGTIYFTETRQLHINIEGDMPPPPGLPTENVNYTVLCFNEAASLYQNDASKQQDDMMMDEEHMNGERVIIRMAPPDNQVYCDLVKKKMIRQEDFMQRKFLIESEMPVNGWKLTGKQKMVLNYPCMEAVKEDSLQTVTAWFTSAIPVSSGPLEFIGLPGMVLEVNINDGETVIVAISVTTDVDTKNLKQPTDGKKVSEEEFNAIVDEKMKEMGIERGSGPSVIIRIEED